MKVTQDQVLEGLKRRGVPEHVARGVVMNFQDESGLNTGIEEKEFNVHGTKGFGIAQWTGGRRSALEEYATKSGRSVDDLDAQLDFFMHENQTSEKSAWSAVMSAQNERDAAVTFVNKWERPAAEHAASRSAKYGGSNLSSDISSDSMSVPYLAPTAPFVAPEVPERASLWQLQKDAYNTQQTLPWLFDSNKDLDPDPNWVMDEKRVRQDFADRGIPETELERYSSRLESVSEVDYQDNLSRITDDFQRKQRLAQAGLTGTVLELANSILDPVALAADVAVGSIAPQVVLGKRASRLGGILAGAIGGGAGAFASEAVAQSVNPNRDQMDMLYATVFGFGVGGVAGKLLGNPHTTAEAIQLQKMGRAAVDSYESSTALGSGSVGAARVGIKDATDRVGQFDETSANQFDETFAGKARLDLSAQMNNSPNLATKAGAGLVQDGVGKKGNAVNTRAASEDQRLLHRQWQVAEARSYKATFSEFKGSITERGWGWQAKAEAQFNDQIDAFMRDTSVDAASKYNPAVVKMGQKYRQLYNEILLHQKNPGIRDGGTFRPVKGADAIHDTGHFAPRYWVQEAVREYAHKWGQSNMEELVYRAMRPMMADVEEQAVRRLAVSFNRAISNRALGIDDLASHNLSGDKLDILLDTLKGHYGLSDGDADALRLTFRPQSSDAGRDAGMKRRMLLDESAEYTTTNKFGVTETMRLRDLFSTDARGNFQRYARTASGRVALSRYRFIDNAGTKLIDGFTSDGEFNAYLKQVSEYAGKNNIPQSQVDKDIRNLELAYASIMGRATDAMENTTAGQFMRIVRKFNFLRIMNQVGFAQVSEFGNMVGQLGLKASISQLPAFRRVLNESGESILKSGLADDLETMLGVGADRLLHASDYRIDDLSGALDHKSGTWLDKAENWLNKGQRFTAEWSGLTQANIVLERWTGAAIMQKFANMAASGKGISRTRLAAIGLDEDMTSRIMKEFNSGKSITYTKGLITNKKVAGINWDKWSDPEAREAFINAAHRWGEQIIQKNDIGNMMPWMSKSWAKVVMQFRTFMAGAYVKQSLVAAKQFRDGDIGPALHSIMLTTMLGAASFAAQSKLLALGRSDGEEWLEKRMEPGSLAAAAFSRAGQSSILPLIVDSLAPLVGQDPVFSHTRTTGQASNVLFGNPTAGLIDDIVGAGGAASGLFEDRAWSQEEARKLVRPMMFQNAMPLVQGLSYMIQDLPERAPRN